MKNHPNHNPDTLMINATPVQSFTLRGSRPTPEEKLVPRLGRPQRPATQPPPAATDPGTPASTPPTPPPDGTA